MARLRRRITPERVKRAASMLRPLQRRVLSLSAGEGLASDEIARRMGLTAERVDRLLVEALVSLHRALERQERPWWRFW
jgi:DNA-directed RNA polymerase specialized sigma24 family protein